MSPHPDLGHQPPAAIDRPLTAPLLVRGGFDNRILVALLFLAGLFLAMAAYGRLQSRPYDQAVIVVLLVLAALCGLPAAVLALWLLPRRRWLEVTLNGFILTRRGEKTALADEQIIALSQRHSTDSQGSTRCDIRLEVDQGGAVEPVHCTYRFPPGQVDPLAAFLDRVVRGLVKRTRENLHRGASLSGKGWRLDARGLHCREEDKPVDPAAVSRASHHAGHLCLWKGDEERPFLRIASASRNAYPLGFFLYEAIASRGEQNKPLPGKPLGRILLDHPSPDLRLGQGVAVFALLLAAVLALVWWGNLPHSHHGGYYALLAAPLPVLALGAFLAARAGRMRLRFHESGVSQLTANGSRELLYSEVGVMVWKAGRQMTFEPLPGLDRPVICFRALHGADTPDLIGLRDHVASVIAGRWWADVRLAPVRWTPRLRFLPGGLEYRPTGFLGAGEPLSAPYHMTGYRIENGQFLLFVTGTTRAVVKESLEGANFFPGLVMLNWIYASYRSAAQEPAPAPAPRLPPSAAEADARITAAGRPGAGITAPPGPPGFDQGEPSE
jgi:hypothetical protein